MDKVLSKDGTAIAFDQSGKGEPVIFEPPFMVGDSGHRPPPDHEAYLARLVSEGRRSDAVRFFMAKVIGMPTIVVAAFRFLPMWSRLKAVANTLPYDAAIMGDYSLPMKRAASVTIPTLVIGGEKSPAVLRRSANELAGVLPYARHRTLEGQTHNVAPKVLAPVLKEFFEG